MSDLIIELTKCPAPFCKHGGVTLYHANCCDVLPYLSGIAGVVSDPPWHLNGYVQTLAKADSVSHAHEIAWYSNLWLFMGAWMTLVQQTGARWGWYFIGMDSAPAFFRLARLIGWPIQHAWPCAQFEWLIYTANAPLVDPSAVPALIARYGTPNVKPMEQIRDLLLLTPRQPSDVILDPFCGDGSTLAAAITLGHSTIGVEAKADRCEAAKVALSELADGSLIWPDPALPPLWQRRFVAPKRVPT